MPVNGLEPPDVQTPLTARPPKEQHPKPPHKQSWIRNVAAVIAVALVATVLWQVLKTGPDLSKPTGNTDNGYLNSEGIEGIVSIDSYQPFEGITYTAQELLLSGETAAVSSDSPSATASGVTVDFGTYNLTGPGTLEIARLPYKTDPGAGLQVQTYNITLGDVDEFSVPVTVTMPYDSGGLTEGEEPYAISVGWYDASQNTWEVMPCTVNSADNTVTFQTDHLSPFAVIKNEMNKGKFVFYYKDNQYRGPNTPVLVDTGALKGGTQRYRPFFL